MFSSFHFSLRAPLLALVGLSAMALAGCGGNYSAAGPSLSSINTGGATGTGGGGSGSFNATFSAASGTNANTCAFSSSNVGGGVTGPVPVVGTLLTLTAVTTPSGGAARQFILVLADTTLTVGKAYPLATDTNNLSYVDDTDINSHDPTTQRTWISTGGTATLDSISGKTYKFHVSAVPMGPTDGGPTTPGTGTFTVDGSGTATLP